MKTNISFESTAAWAALTRAHTGPILVMEASFAALADVGSRALISGTASESLRRQRGTELNDCLPTSAAPLLEGMLQRAEVRQRGSEGR